MKILQLPLLKKPIHLQPPLHIRPIPPQPTRLRTNRILTLLQRTIKPLRTPPLKEALHLFQLFLGRETRRAHLHHRTQHRQTRREFLLEDVPVFFHPGPEGPDARFVRAESGDGEVEVLAFDFVAEGEGEGAFDEGGGGGAAEGAEGCVALVGVFGGAVFV